MSNGDLFLILIPLYIIALNVTKKDSLTWYISFWGLSINAFLAVVNGILEIIKDLK